MKRAFTLIELLIVIAIIAILALIAIPNFLEAQIRAKYARALSDMRSLATGIESYYVDNNSYPINPNPPAGQLHQMFVKGVRYMSSLSTPIAYVGAHSMFDPFFDMQNTNPYWNGYWFCNFLGAVSYIRHNAPSPTSPPPNWYNSTGGLTPSTPYLDCPVPLRFNSFKTLITCQEDRAYPSTWALISVGPDRQIQDFKLNNVPGKAQPQLIMAAPANYTEHIQGRTVLYDPSNGTVSNGNIWRLSCDTAAGR